MEVDREHVVEILDQGAGLRTVREGVDVWEKIGLRQEREREVRCWVSAAFSALV